MSGGLQSAVANDRAYECIDFQRPRDFPLYRNRPSHFSRTRYAGAGIKIASEAMKIALTILFAVAFLGSLFWVKTRPEEVEPYVSTVLCVAAMVGVLHESKRKDANIVPRIQCRQVERFGKSSIDHALVVENDGDHQIRDFFIRLNADEESKGPIWNSEREFVHEISVPVIHPGQRFEWRFVLFVRGRFEFDGVWGWTTIRNKKEIRRGIIKPESLPRS